MKKYKSIILLFGCLCMASCSDFLDTESLSEQTGEVIYENEGMTRSAIMGIYSQQIMVLLIIGLIVIWKIQNVNVFLKCQN